jgi:hypothetical protein
MKRDRVVELQVHQNPIFILLKNSYSNNKFWEQQFFLVSGEWECSSSEELPKDQRIPWEWRPLADDLQEPPQWNIVN